MPAWVPGSGFQVIGRKGKESREAYANKPFQPVFEAVVSIFVYRRGVVVLRMALLV